MYTLRVGVYMVMDSVWYLQRTAAGTTDWGSAFIEKSGELYEETALNALYENRFA